MQHDMDIRLSDIKKSFKHHRFSGLLFLVICVLLELWVIHFPPRGVTAEDVIVIGSVLGKPLVKFEPLWQRIINDDNFMLQIIERAKICNNKTSAEKLVFLNKSIRHNLRFQQENETLIRISFKRPGYRDVRPFLNCFTEALMQHLKNLSDEDFKLRKEKVRLQFSKITEYIRHIARIFKVPGIINLLETDENNIFKTHKMIRSSETAGLTVQIGELLIGEILPDYFSTGVSYDQHFNDNLEILKLYPRSPILLSSKEAPPVPVQPFYELIFILIPVGLGLIYIAFLIILKPVKKDL